MMEGTKVLLRPLRLEDAGLTLELRHDMEANSNLMGFPFPVNLENEKEWIVRLYPQGERKSIYLALCENNGGGFVGYLSVRNINYIHGTAEFGIGLLKEARGKGYALEAMTLFFDYLHRDIHLRKLTLRVLEHNAVALHLYEKIGFEREGVLKQHIWQGGQYKNVILMGLFLDKRDKKGEKAA